MNRYFLILSLISSFYLSGCNSKSGFNLSETISSTNNGNTSQGGSGNTGTGGTNGSEVTWDKVQMDGIATSMDFDNKLVIKIEKQTQSLLMIFPLPSFVALSIFDQIPIPQLEGAYLTNYQNSQGDKQLALSIPLKYIVKGAQFLPNQKLPNGDPLPYVPSGELPGFAFSLPQNQNYHINIYIGVNVAAAFVEFPQIALPITGIFPVKNSSKTKTIGAIGYIAPQSNYAGGMYLATQIPDAIAVMIDELIRW